MNINIGTCEKLNNTNQGKHYISTGSVRKYIFGAYMLDGQRILGSAEIVPANINNLEDTDILKSLSLKIGDAVIEWQGGNIEKHTSDGWLISVVVKTNDRYCPEATKYLIYLDNRLDGNIAFNIFEPQQRAFGEIEYHSKDFRF